ncbi:MAG: hypothetical protein IJ814_08135 [Paludibacteraceae bacterium]|nr:hypothetical protein [Paludibacteraceae bacterium]
MKNAVNRALVAKKRAISIQLSAVRRSILVLILCSFSAAVFTPVKAQEAFYIYRNDGNFNGFFYDEVQEMRYSKLALDSTEQEQYVTYEVVLADTTYRIPLASIDSIGFQQPEIKFNPKVKFMEKDGYSPYVNLSTFVIGWGVEKQTYYFRNLPDNMIPQVGDVLIGLPTDTHAELYSDGGSFSCIVESVTLSDREYDEGPVKMCYVEGRCVEAISDVFEQYITVEQIGVKPDGKVVRRIAGCTPDGLPRKIKNIDDKVEITLIDKDVQLIREWQATPNAKFDLTADIGVKYKLRAAYNITWTRFMVKISHDLSLKVKPSLGMQVSQSVEATLDDWWVTLPKIMFPAAAPVFETDPVPVPFIRAEGTLEARLNLPAVHMGIGDDIIFDSNNIFPVSFGLHLVPDENKEVTDDMLDLSANVTLSGYVQTGILFKANVSTASWFKKVLKGDVGLYLYCGPKVSSRFNLGAKDFTTGEWNPTEWKPYEYLRESNLSLTLISLDLEAKATAAAFWKDPVEKTFFKSNWGWLTDTVFFAPSFRETMVDTTGGAIKITLRKQPKQYLGFSTADIAICNYEGYVGTGPIIKTVGHFALSYHPEDSLYTYTMTKADLEGLAVKEYAVFPYVKCGPWGPYRAIVGTIGKFYPPVEYQMLSDHLEFNGNEGDTASVSFTTNCLPDRISCYGNSDWIKFDRLEVQDSAKHKYRAVFKAKYNNTLFDRKYDKNYDGAPAIRFWDKGKAIDLKLSAHQKPADLSIANINLTFSAGASSGSAKIGQKDGNLFINYNGPVTVTRQGENAILITGTATTTQNDVTETVQVAFTIEKANGSNYSDKGRPSTICTNGTMTRHAEYTIVPTGSGYTYSTDAQYTFSTANAKSDQLINEVFSASYAGNISGTWDHQETYYYIYDGRPGHSTSDYHLDITPDMEGNRLNFTITITPPSAQ